jgi:poly(3-hydroxybutyrate) depolymerase
MLASLGCSSGEGGDTPSTPIFTNSMGGNGVVPTAGTPGAGGAGVTAGSSSGGVGTAGTPPGGGAPPVGGSGGGVPGGGESSGGTGGASPGGPITKVWKSDGCGKAYAGPMGGQAIVSMTKGEKDANCADALGGEPKCGLWGQPGSTWRTEPVPRDHYIYLPANYDPAKPYTLMLLGPGCGGNGTNIYPYNNNADGTIIRVGFTPPPNYVGHGTNQNQGCFDDKEGDDSVDWVQYEMVMDKLNAELCFDRNRVFAGGNSSGAWWSNELGCKYAGDAKYPIRGIIPNTGGLPTDAAHVPTCTNAPMAGMWIHEINDGTNPFSGNKVAIARAMSHNSCTIGSNFDNTMFDDFPIGGGQADNVCKKIRGCDPLYPLVVCPLPGNGHGSHDNVVNPGASTYLKMFSAGEFLTQ